MFGVHLQRRSVIGVLVKCNAELDCEGVARSQRSNRLQWILSPWPPTLSRTESVLRVRNRADLPNCVTELSRADFVTRWEKSPGLVHRSYELRNYETGQGLDVGQFREDEGESP